MFTCSPDQGSQTNVVRCLCHSSAFARFNAEFSRSYSRRSFLGGVAAVGAATLLPRVASARIPDAPASPIAFTNIRVFDGKSASSRLGLRVVIDGNKIKAVEPTEKPVEGNVRVIDGGGRTLMPGLIDAHWHCMMAAAALNTLLSADIGYINLLAAEEAERTLMRGFTSVRDVGGPSFGLKRAIDSFVTPGPRIWPSGAMISQTSGHGDFRYPYEIPSQPDAPLSHAEVYGVGSIADGVDAVLKRSREQLMLGASQLKLMAGGGVASNYDPLDVSQYTEAEFRAAVDSAENWGTYVAIHAYTPKAIQTAIRAGVRCIEHGQLMDEDTAKLIRDKDVWLSAQPFLDDEDAIPFPEGSANRAKQLQMVAGTDFAYGHAKTYKLKTAWGTDTLFDAKLATRQGAQLAKMTRWYSPAEVLKAATGANAELLAMSGPRNPYPSKIGVVEEGAYADLLLIDGDPIADIQLVADTKNLTLIMKDGRIYKDNLETR
jgi:imidazolonepropionase-like amidohydrolase